MKKINLFTLGVSLTALFYACNSGTDGSGKAADSVTTLSSTDTLTPYDSATTVHNAADTASNPVIVFATKAGAGSLMEIQLGELSQVSAENKRVRDFGAMVLKDHKEASESLNAIATAKHIIIPSTLPVKIQGHVNQMKNLKGAEFDKHYIDMMVKDHKEDIKLFEEASKNAKDAEIKAFAAKTLPVLKKHLDSATAIKKILK